MENKKSFFHLHLISDSTGETLMSAGRAVSAQFHASMPVEHVYPMIRNQKQLAQVIDLIDKEPGIVLYTIVDQQLAEFLDLRCHAIGVPCVNASDTAGAPTISPCPPRSATVSTRRSVMARTRLLQRCALV